MEWRIRESGHGGFVAECGIAHPGDVRVGAVGSTMPAFIAKDSHLCQYCGSVVKDSKNEDILCDDCYELFGHRYFSEL